ICLENPAGKGKGLDPTRKPTVAQITTDTITSAGFNALRIHACRAIILPLDAGACVPIRHRNSDGSHEMYVHGYHPRENERLQDQAGTLVGLLHSDTTYSGGSTVLEVGCGVCAQTVHLALQSPVAGFR